MIPIRIDGFAEDSGIVELGYILHNAECCLM